MLEAYETAVHLARQDGEDDGHIYETEFYTEWVACKMHFLHLVILFSLQLLGRFCDLSFMSTIVAWRMTIDFYMKELLSAGAVKALEKWVKTRWGSAGKSLEKLWLQKQKLLEKFEALQSDATFKPAKRGRAYFKKAAASLPELGSNFWEVLEVAVLVVRPLQHHVLSLQSFMLRLRTNFGLAMCTRLRMANLFYDLARFLRLLGTPGARVAMLCAAVGVSWKMYIRESQQRRDAWKLIDLFAKDDKARAAAARFILSYSGPSRFIKMIKRDFPRELAGLCRAENPEHRISPRLFAEVGPFVFSLGPSAQRVESLHSTFKAIRKEAPAIALPLLFDRMIIRRNRSLRPREFGLLYQIKDKRFKHRLPASLGEGAVPRRACLYMVAALADLEHLRRLKGVERIGQDALRGLDKQPASGAISRLGAFSLKHADLIRLRYGCGYEHGKKLGVDSAGGPATTTSTTKSKGKGQAKSKAMPKKAMKRAAKSTAKAKAKERLLPVEDESEEALGLAQEQEVEDEEQTQEDLQKKRPAPASAKEKEKKELRFDARSSVEWDEHWWFVFDIRKTNAVLCRANQSGTTPNLDAFEFQTFGEDPGSGQDHVWLSELLMFQEFRSAYKAEQEKRRKKLLEERQKRLQSAAEAQAARARQNQSSSAAANQDAMDVDPFDLDALGPPLAHADAEADVGAGGTGSGLQDQGGAASAPDSEPDMSDWYVELEVARPTDARCICSGDVFAQAPDIIRKKVLMADLLPPIAKSNKRKRTAAERLLASKRAAATEKQKRAVWETKWSAINENLGATPELPNSLPMRPDVYIVLVRPSSKKKNLQWQLRVPLIGIDQQGQGPHPPQAKAKAARKAPKVFNSYSKVCASTRACDIERARIGVIQEACFELGAPFVEADASEKIKAMQLCSDLVKMWRREQGIKDDTDGQTDQVSMRVPEDGPLFDGDTESEWTDDQDGVSVVADSGFESDQGLDPDEVGDVDDLFFSDQEDDLLADD
ncbi:unnamed protein product [Amoebophrya sp. A25]|nr:unnamed protein product [Amoebophrya sp. A25]|eukprot:GSA25T00022958001.1